MIRRCVQSDFEQVLAVINDAASAYRGVIPPDRWKEPYMSDEELRREIEQGVDFWGWEEKGNLAGVMGMQEVREVVLLRHAYVRSRDRRRGIGSALLASLMKRIDRGRPVLVGTWADAGWAVSFYEKRGFRMVTPAEKDRLLAEYWSIPSRQVETSVVLANRAWFDGPGREREEG